LRYPSLLNTLKGFDHFDRGSPLPYWEMDHRYIDENSVAERYLGNALAAEDREAFERHLVDCQECTDRLLLAGMFHSRGRNGASPENGPKALAGPGEARPAERVESAPPPGLVVRLKPLQLFWILLISVLLLFAIPILVRLFF
jgi:anti-sigma factor RsiW